VDELVRERDRLVGRLEELDKVVEKGLKSLKVKDVNKYARKLEEDWDDLSKAWEEWTLAFERKLGEDP
jgi:predicted nuclease with TOPRIM domain